MMMLSKNKYGAVKTTVLGIKFDSKLEASFYLPLKRLCEKFGLLLSLQVRYALYSVGKKMYYYKSDFTIYNCDGTKEFIVDAKGFLTNISKHKIDIVRDKYRHPVYVGKSIVRCLYELRKYFGLDDAS